MKQWKTMMALVLCTLLLISLATGCDANKESVTATRPDYQSNAENTQLPTETTQTLPDAPEEEFVIVFEPDREPLATVADAEQIVEGMSLEDVWNIMGNPQWDLQIGELNVEWDLQTGEKFSVYFQRDDAGAFYASSIAWEYPAPSITEEEALDIAEDLIVRYQWQRAVGVCCDFTMVDGDLSAYLTEEQMELYYGIQYRLECCHSAEEVREHIHQVVDPDLVAWYPDVVLVKDDAGELYVLVVPMGMTTYGEITIECCDQYEIIATTVMSDESGPFATARFTIERIDDSYRISKVEIQNT